MITSPQNPKLKLVRALMGRARERRAAGAFVAEGIRLVEEALQAEWPFRFVLARPQLSERGQILLDRLRRQQIEVEIISEALLDTLSDTRTSQGILAVLALAGKTPPRSGPDFVLIADRIRDPGNLGALLRTGAAAGVQAVFLPPETTDAFSPKVVRAGMGAHFRLALHSLTWPEIQRAVAGLNVYLAEANGQRVCWQADFRSPLALIVGNEAEGPSQQARAIASETISIPMPGGIESLNAAIAGAILMFEVVRQRGYP